MIRRAGPPSGMGRRPADGKIEKQSPGVGRGGRARGGEGNRRARGRGASRKSGQIAEPRQSPRAGSAERLTHVRPARFQTGRRAGQRGAGSRRDGPVRLEFSGRGGRRGRPPAENFRQKADADGEIRPRLAFAEKPVRQLPGARRHPASPCLAPGPAVRRDGSEPQNQGGELEVDQQRGGIHHRGDEGRGHDRRVPADLFGQQRQETAHQLGGEYVQNQREAHH